MLPDPTLDNDRTQDKTNDSFFLQSRSHEQSESDNVDTARHLTSSPEDIKHKERHLEKENTSRTFVNHKRGRSCTETRLSLAVQAVNTHAGLISSTEREKRSGWSEQQDSLDHSVPQCAMVRRSDHAGGTLTVLVSKWLSFGRMLFSPAHFQAQGQPKCELLVIDSLGNGTWKPVYMSEN